MRHFRGKVAVITGGGGGIGTALARRFAREGVRIVLSDINERTLDAAVESLKRDGADVVGVQANIADPGSVHALARSAMSQFGAVHILCNNAGVVDAAVPIWAFTARDWQWMFGVNFWGIIHGIQAFVPIMLGQDEEAHIVNTASIDGLTFGSGPGGAIYGASKHATVNASESLYLQLAQTNPKIGVSVLCPGAVNTGFIDAAAESRPRELRDPVEKTHAQKESVAALKGLLKGGLRPEAVADEVFAAVLSRRFYILPSPELDQAIKQRMERILSRENWNSQPAT